MSKFVYQDLIETRDPLVWVGCRDQLGITKSASYYRKSITPKIPKFVFARPYTYIYAVPCRSCFSCCCRHHRFFSQTNDSA